MKSKKEKKEIEKLKEEALARGEVFVDMSIPFIRKFILRDASKCPICGKKLENSWLYYNATETQKVELTGVYVTKSYGNEVEQAVTYRKVNDDLQHKNVIVLNVNIPFIPVLYHTMKKKTILFKKMMDQVVEVVGLEIHIMYLPLIKEK